MSHMTCPCSSNILGQHSTINQGNRPHNGTSEPTISALRDPAKYCCSVGKNQGAYTLISTDCLHRDTASDLSMSTPYRGCTLKSGARHAQHERYSGHGFVVEYHISTTHRRHRNVWRSDASAHSRNVDKTCASHMPASLHSAQLVLQILARR